MRAPRSRCRTKSASRVQGPQVPSKRSTRRWSADTALSLATSSGLARPVDQGVAGGARASGSTNRLSGAKGARSALDNGPFGAKRVESRCLPGGWREARGSRRLSSVARTPRIPPELTRGPFSLEEARAAGLTLSALRGKGLAAPRC